MRGTMCARDRLEHSLCQAEIDKGALKLSQTHSTYLFSPHQGSYLTFLCLVHIIVPFS